MASAHHDLVVIGASAGGVEALKQLIPTLPASFRGAICIVLHLPARSTSVLPAILTKIGNLPARAAVHGEPLRRGHIYVAPPDHHLMIHADHIQLSRGPRVNNHRPAIDPLFFSAARWMGRQTISVVLSGTLDDGTSGSQTIRFAGGVTIAQDPNDALYAAMPRNAIEQTKIDYVLPASEIGALLTKLTTTEGVTKEPDVITRSA